jgi:hypothetical protein
MDIETYEIGQLVRLTAAFTNAADRPIDPSEVSVTVTTPAGNATTSTYAGGSVKKDSVGHYHFDQSADVAGTWRFRWFSTGSGQAASHGEFIVQPAE